LISRSHGFYINYVDLAVRRNYSSPAARALRRPRRAPRLLVSGRTRSTSTSSCTASTRLHSPGWQRSTSTTPRVWVPRLVARLVTRLVAPLIVDYSRLVVDYFASATRPGASARCAAHQAARRATRR
jgi:hypothetical protein